MAGARWHVVPLAGRIRLSGWMANRGEIYPAKQSDRQVALWHWTDAKRACCGNPRFSPDGKHIAYAINTDTEKQECSLIIEPGPVFDSVVNGPFFTPDGNHFAYLAVMAGGRSWWKSMTTRLYVRSN